MWTIGGLITVIAVTGFMYRDLLIYMAMGVYFKPSTAFAETVAPTAPDYSNTKHWAALPNREDAADFTPEGISDGQADADVDV